MLQKITIAELLKTWTPTAISDIVDSATLSNVLTQYGERTYIFYGDSEDEGAANIATAWDIFVNIHAANFERISAAMSEKYKPLENYSMFEHSERTDALNDTTKHNTTTTNENSATGTSEDKTTTTTTNTGTVTDEGTRANTGTVSNSGNSTNTNSVSAYDSTSMTPRDSTTANASDTRTDNLNESSSNTRTDNTTSATENGGTITNSTSANGTTTTEGNTTATHSGTVTNDLTRSGNIGVTTSQQMLTSELFLRVRNNVAYYAVELFISQHTTW